jgi:hypothetical protein
MIKKNTKTRKMKGGAIETRSIKKTDKKPSNLTKKTNTQITIPKNVIPRQNYKPIAGGKTIVLYISAHGTEDRTDNMPLVSCQCTYVQTLSFAGHIGNSGIIIK